MKPLDGKDRCFHGRSPGRVSKTAIVNAVTRAAHTEEWRSWTTSEDLERAGGELLYARVWNVQMPETPPTL